MPPTPTERLWLLNRLGRDLASQSVHDAWSTDLEHLQALEVRIQDTARQLEPAAPEAAVLAARQRLAYHDLAGHLIRRAELPADATYAAEAVRVQTRWQDTRILDLARQLEPRDPRLAIDLALPRAREHIQRNQTLHADKPVPGHQATRERLAETARQMKRLATFPQPTRQQRVHQVLGDLRRLEQLDRQHRDASEVRRHLASRGNVIELEARLQRIPIPRDLLEESVAEIYRDPDRAIRGMRERTRSHGLQGTIERFDKNPAAFGRLRGFHVPGIGDSPERSKALDLVWHSSGYANNALGRRDRMETELEAAVSHQRLQNESRELIRAYPSREKLLTELGRHMKGLEIHELRPLLRTGQARLVQDVRKAELTFLEPLRKAKDRFRALDVGRGQAVAHAQKIAGLFRGAPNHILRRLTPPQLQAVIVATTIAKRAAKVVTRAARV